MSCSPFKYKMSKRFKYSLQLFLRYAIKLYFLKRKLFIPKLITFFSRFEKFLGEKKIIKTYLKKIDFNHHQKKIKAAASSLGHYTSGQNNVV